MPSKQVTDRQKSARAVAAAAQTHAGQAAAGFKEHFQRYLKGGESLPDVALLIRLLGRAVAADGAALVAADEAHEKERSDDAEPRDSRNEAADEVRALLVDLRSSVETAYRQAGLIKLGLDGAVPRDPSVLNTMGKTVEKALLDETIELGTPGRRGLALDRAAFAGELGEALPALQEALDDVARETREAESTQMTKNQAMDRYDTTFGRAARLLSAAFAAAELVELAAKVRPSTRRPGTTIEQESESPAEPETGAAPEEEQHSA